MRGRYGVDAPGLVRAFLLVGILFAVLGFGLLKWAGSRPWTGWVAASLLAISAYGLGMFAYMLWGSLVTKVRGREAILDLIDWTGGEEVLDVGCGRGLLLVGAAKRLTTGHATGIDLWIGRDQSSNEKDAPLENARVEGVAARVSVETGDMRELPFSDNSFDVVLSHWAVHNLDDRAERACALAEMVRVLRSGRSVLLTDIACREEYAAELGRLGLMPVRLVVASQWSDRLNKIVSFGSFQPATLVARKP
jgi:SAM-dependent methyltransferase